MNAAEWEEERRRLERTESEGSLMTLLGWTSLQEKHLTTLGESHIALGVSTTLESYDDCDEVRAIVPLLLGVAMAWGAV